MANKRVTIYDLAKELGVSASYVSRALNNHPSISEKVKERVRKKAMELNYTQNTHAANLRKGSSKTIGVIVPHINQYFFSEAISGIEEVCAEHQHSLIICQSLESFEKECAAIDTLIHKNVDCIMISVSAETQASSHLELIRKNNIQLIQFDRCLDRMHGYKVVNDNKESAYKVVQYLVSQGYRKIAFLGGPEHLPVFKNRKLGYLQAIKEAKLVIPYNFIVENVLYKESAEAAAAELLSLQDPPDAFCCVSDHQSLGTFQVAKSMGITVPDQLGLSGYANELFTQINTPTLSSVDQNAKELGRRTASVYFDYILQSGDLESGDHEEVIESNIIVRRSSTPQPVTATV
jgi:DNA-binding LacI/PurR family transcriptional regulator